MLCVQDSSFLFFLPSFYFLHSFLFRMENHALRVFLFYSNLYGDSCIACKSLIYMETHALRARAYLSFLFYSGLRASE